MTKLLSLDLHTVSGLGLGHRCQSGTPQRQQTSGPPEYLWGVPPAIECDCTFDGNVARNCAFGILEDRIQEGRVIVALAL